MNRDYQNSIPLTFIAIFFLFISLYFLKSIVVPIIISLLLITLIIPINRYLNDRIPKQIGDTLSFIILLLFVSVFFYSFYFSISDITTKAPDYKDSIVSFYNDFRVYLLNKGFPVPRELGAETVQEIGEILVKESYIILGYIAFTIGLVILGIPELINWRKKLKSLFGEANGNKIIKALRESASSFQKYLLVTTWIGILSALLTGGFTWYIGLDFPLTWAFLAFLLNYIPIVGAFLIIIPPTILAYIQFSDPELIFSVFLGMTVIQFFIGSIIDPKFQGKYLSMSSVVILVSIAFWGYLWGIIGAFLAVPITNSIMITFFHFPATKWLSDVISEET